MISYQSLLLSTIILNDIKYSHSFIRERENATVTCVYFATNFISCHQDFCFLFPVPFLLPRVLLTLVFV